MPSTHHADRPSQIHAWRKIPLTLIPDQKKTIPERGYDPGTMIAGRMSDPARSFTVISLSKFPVFRVALGSNRRLERFRHLCAVYALCPGTINISLTTSTRPSLKSMKSVPLEAKKVRLFVAMPTPVTNFRALHIDHWVLRWYAGPLFRIRRISRILMDWMDGFSSMNGCVLLKLVLKKILQQKY
jgi:hypothetical protein